MDISKVVSIFGGVGLIALYLGLFVILLFLAISLAKLIVWPSKIEAIRRSYQNGLIFGFDLVLFGTLVSIFTNRTPQDVLVFFVVSLVRSILSFLIFKESNLRVKKQ